MNKNIMCFISGLAIGVIAGILGGKKLYEKKAQEDANRRADKEIEDMREHYEETYGEAIRSKYDYIKESSAQVKRIQDRLNILKSEIEDYEDEDELVDYTRYTEYYGTDMHPVDSDEDEDEYGQNIEEEPEEEPVVDSDEEAFVRLQEERYETKNRPPKIISEDSLGDIPGYYSQEILFYYEDDDVIVTENEEVIPDYETILGDCLTRYGFIDNDEELIFVRNYYIDTVYEIKKIHDAYYA